MFGVKFFAKLTLVGPNASPSRDTSRTASACIASCTVEDATIVGVVGDTAAVETMDMGAGAMAMGGGGGVVGEMDFNSSYAVGTELEVLYHDAQESGWFAARVTHRKKTGLRVLYALDGYSELIVWVDVEVR
jgi:hypothetical protein